MTSFVSHTSVDCADAYALSEFWKQVLGYVDVEGALINNGTINGPVAQDGSVQQIQVGLAGSDFDRYAARLREALLSVADADDRLDLGEALNALKEAATTSEPEVEVVRRRGEFLKRQAGRIGDATVTAAASELVAQLLALLAGG